jgi:hypothetical protein
MSVSVGSLAAARRNYLGVRCVPISASHDSVFSVSFGETDAQIQFLSGGYVPTTDTGAMKVRSDLRPETNPQHL